MIPFVNRFHGHNSLNYVYKNGQTIRSRLLSICYIKNPHNKNSRIAVVISKKTLKSAVKRNRIRRRIYEYMQLQLSKLHGIYDIVIIVQNSELLSSSSADLRQSIDQLLEQAGVINPSKD